MVSDNYKWYLENDFSKYEGKWLAIVDKKVVNVADSNKEAFNSLSKDLKARTPLIVRVRKDKTLTGIGEKKVEKKKKVTSTRKKATTSTLRKKRSKSNTFHKI